MIKIDRIVGCDKNSRECAALAVRRVGSKDQVLLQYLDIPDQLTWAPIDMFVTVGRPGWDGESS